MDVRVRAAVLDDAAALGRVMVEAWLAAHHGQVPEVAWQRRVEEWTPEASASSWARLLAEHPPRTFLLVAEDQKDDLLGLVLADGEDESGSTAQVRALYVLPRHQGHGLGRLLLASVAGRLASLGFSRLHIGVLTANAPARAFYEAMGGREVGERTFDEDGFLLPETVYEWPDLGVLVTGSRP